MLSRQRRQTGRHAITGARRPLARTGDLIIEHLEDELLVYDLENARAHCVGPVAARVWNACDGKSDIAQIAAALEMSQATVERALDELEHSELLDNPELVVLNGNGNGDRVGDSNGNGNGITRRQLTIRSAKFGAAAASAPLILSIAAPTALAATTPTPHQCQIYTVKDCGASTGCGSVAGCCCCCQGGGSCKVCSATNFCNAGMQTCPGGGTGHCSDTGSGGTPSAQGCCGISGSTDCGCAFGSHAGCCDPHNSFKTCTPGSTSTCVPCCNGVPLPQNAAFGCCATATSTC